jgi:hypothetical protein
MRPRNVLGYYLCLLLTFLVFLTAAASIRHAQRSLDDSEMHDVGVLTSSIAPDAPSIVSHSRLRKRMGLIRLNNGWLGRLQSFDAILPGPVASTAFALFYEKIMTDVLETWADYPQTSHLRLHMDGLRLDMASTGEIPIPWNLVFQFANAMRQATEKGAAMGRFVGFFAHPTLGIGVGVHVWMGIVQVAEAA